MHKINITRGLTSKVMNGIKTFVFLDSETTGLPWMEYNKTRITELCLVSVQAEHLRLGVFPRVQNKLKLCFNPQKLISNTSTDITGLSNDLLEYQPNFSNETVNALQLFLNHNEEPVCLVAHNGNKFDFPILRAEINKANSFLTDQLLCVDSLPLFRNLHQQEQTRVIETEASTSTEQIPVEFCDGYDDILSRAAEHIEQDLERSGRVFGDGYDEILSQAVDDIERDMERLGRVLIQKKCNETTPKRQIIKAEFNKCCKKNLSFVRENQTEQKFSSRISFKLSDIFTRLTKKPPIGEHSAEGDVNMLIMCAATLGDKFVDCANCNAQKFSEIPIMTPGRKLGT